MSEHRHWLALLRAAGVGPALGRALLAHCGPQAESVFAAGRAAWRAAGASDAVCAALATPDWPGVEQDLAWLEQPRHHFIPLDDARYPARLKTISDAPLALYVVGDTEVLSLPQLGIVGSRNPTTGGIEHAREFAEYLGRNGLVITSGLALGIDAAAHEGALAANSLTVAVLGTGPDQVYPARHKNLAARIADSGALVSEFPPGTPALAEHFPRRNRLISGLSLGVLVVEAALKSGSLITARLALEQGREVFAIPGSIHNPLAKGCHRLIREGAKLVESGQDIFEELGSALGPAFVPGPPSVDNARPAQKAGRAEADVDYSRLLTALGHEPQRVDQLVEATGLTIAAVSSMLLILELQGQVAVAPGGAYVRNR
ncbi:MAG: DNA-processing protein DprA [Nevskiales bacterium]